MKREPLVYDWTGKYFDVCNFCGKVDILVPVSTLHICPDCVKKGEWHYTGEEKGYKYTSKSGATSRIRLAGSFGQCDICGVYAVGAIFSVDGWACFKCLWNKIAKRNDALRPGGSRIV